MRAPLDDLVAAAHDLVAAVVADDSGQMVGNQWMGGNGGLLSRETIRRADMLRLALDAYENPPTGIPAALGDEGRQ